MGKYRSKENSLKKKKTKEWRKVLKEKENKKETKM